LKAAVYNQKRSNPSQLVEIVDVPRPELSQGKILLRVLACGVCRTDLHITEGDLPPLLPVVIPGHQIVGEVIDGATSRLPTGTRVGVSWMGGTDGNCWYCQNNMENLCDHPMFTGYSVNGGYAEYVLVREDFAFPLPGELENAQVAPPLCAGIIASAAYVLPESSPGRRWGCSASGALRPWQFESFNFGDAKSTS